MELFEIHPYNFLVKPLNMEKVCKQIQKILQLNYNDRRFFTYTYNKNQYKVLVGDIIYFQSDRHHIKIICKTSTKEYVGKIKTELEKFPDNFVRINQSDVINIRHIRECFGIEIVMDNGDILPISRKYRDMFNTKMLENSKWGELKNELI